MTTNVFGSEVTEMTVREFPGHDDPKIPITHWDLAKVALDMSNAENKLELARAYLDGLKAKFGDGCCAKVLIYNATGATMSFVRSYDWHGHVGESAYPTEIKNGQWGAFFHQKPGAMPTGTEGAVVYRLKGPMPQDGESDCMISWSAPWGPWYNNHCYAEIREMDHFNDVWGLVEDKMVNTGQHCVEEKDFLKATVTIGASTTAECQATIALTPNN